MNNVSIKIHKTVETDGTYVPSFTLKLSVLSAEGVTPCIFVHEYIPKNPYSDARYEFTNVAYFDELTEVPDYLQHRNRTCLIRKSDIEKRFTDKASLDRFLSTVSHDIQRLIQQAETTTATGECEDITFTATAVVSEPAECLDRVVDPEVEDQPPADAVILSFDGK